MPEIIEKKMKEEITIRSEIPKDYLKIARVNKLAFNRIAEAELVDSLRKLAEFDPRLSLVAESKKEIIGHILLFPIHIMTEAGPFNILSLGPIAVHPEYQNQGIGGLLIKGGHQAAIEIGFSAVVLLGHPNYYPKFGYQQAVKWGLSNPWGNNSEAFMAIELVFGSLSGKAGMCIYPDAYFRTS